MADHRTIDSEFWRDRKLLRLPLEARYLYIGLVTGYADDEGRFVVDSADIHRQLFFPADPATPDQVELWVNELAALGLILLYVSQEHDQDETFGFLPGWYKRQILPKLYRSTSSLPEPPLKVCSWRRVDLIHESVKKHEGRDRLASTQAVRLFCDLTDEEQAKLCPSLTEDYVTLAKTVLELQGKGGEVEGEGKGSTPPTPPPDDGEFATCNNDKRPTRLLENERRPEPQPRQYDRDGVPGDLHELKQEFPNTDHACANLNWPHRFQAILFATIVSAITNDGFPRDDEHAAKLLQDEPPKVKEQRLPQMWLQRVEPEPDEPKDNRAAAVEEALAELDREKNAAMAAVPGKWKKLQEDLAAEKAEEEKEAKQDG